VRIGRGRKVKVEEVGKFIRVKCEVIVRNDADDLEEREREARLDQGSIW
jgi:hypothetical protein